MPDTLTYPGVYIQELPSAVRTITSVTTSVTAFVGQTRQGPVNTPVDLTSFADYERRFGGLHPDSAVSYAVQQFFRNGGSRAIVVRLAKDAVSAEETLGGLTVTSVEPGDWTNGLRVRVDPTTAEGGFDLRVTHPGAGREEEFFGLTMATVQDAVNGSSSLVTVTADGPAPEPSGTVSAPLSGVSDVDRVVTATVTRAGGVRRVRRVAALGAGRATGRSRGAGAGAGAGTEVGHDPGGVRARPAGQPGAARRTGRPDRRPVAGRPGRA